MTDASARPHQQRGFTLIEAILVIVLISALAAVAGLFIVQPFSAARDMTRRAELTDAAETALDRMTREIRLAVPNSVRVNAAGDALEFLRSKTGGRYRRLNRSDGTGDPIDPNAAGDIFDALGGVVGSITTRGAGRDCALGNGDCIVINNTGTTGFDAYAGDNIAAITDTPAANQLQFDTGGSTPAFPAHSARQRFQVVDTVVSYVCGGGEINRHQDYGLNASQDPNPGGTINLLARDVTACSFDYDAGAGQRHGLVTIGITLKRKGESVHLIDQAHVVNVP